MTELQSPLVVPGELRTGSKDILQPLLKSMRVIEGDFSFLKVLGPQSIVITPQDQIFFHLILGGRPVLCDKVSGQTTELSIGDYIFVLHSRPHTLGGAESSHCNEMTYFSTKHDNDIPNSLVLGHGNPSMKTLSGTVSLDKNLMTSLSNILPPILLVTARNRGIAHETKSVYEARHILYTANKAGGTQFLTRLVDLFLLEAIRICTAEITLPPDEVIQLRRMTHIIDALQIITNEFHEKWSVASLAKRVNMSRSAFAAAFNHAVGQPPLQYLTAVRMRRAVEILKNEPVSIKEITFRVGYESEIAFGRAFKRSFGMTPTEYRRKLEEPAHSYLVNFGHLDEFVSPYR